MLAFQGIHGWEEGGECENWKGEKKEEGDDVGLGLGLGLVLHHKRMEVDGREVRGEGGVADLSWGHHHQESLEKGQKESVKEECLIDNHKEFLGGDPHDHHKIGSLLQPSSCLPAKIL